MDLSLHPRWVSVHPVVLAMTAAAAHSVYAAGGAITVSIPDPDIAFVNYLIRMGLFEHLHQEPPRVVRERESAGRFIPITRVRTPADLRHFLADMVPLLHESPDEVRPVKFILGELVRNVLEHAESPGGAFVCAQYYKKGEKVALGVADCGVGVRQALSYNHPTASDLDAIYLALRPGVTGTTKRLGGTSDNAGAGLFYTKSLAVLSQARMAVYSGDGFFKLLKTPKGKPLRIQSDSREDHHTTVRGVPRWQGTIVGIDIAVEPVVKFSEAFERIGRAFNVDLRERRTAVAKKRPRFTR